MKILPNKLWVVSIDHGDGASIWNHAVFTTKGEVELACERQIKEIAEFIGYNVTEARELVRVCTLQGVFEYYEI